MLALQQPRLFQRGLFLGQQEGTSLLSTPKRSFFGSRKKTEEKIVKEPAPEAEKDAKKEDAAAEEETK